MTLEQSLQRIKEFISRRYKDNLAGLLVFGSANTGHFREGKSDIDTMIFLKLLKGLDLDEEAKFLREALEDENFATQYFHTLRSIRKYVKERISWSTRITISGERGSKILYTTPEFEKLRRELKENFPSKEDIQKYLQEKDKIELDGYFRNIKDFDLTKALMAHIRRKLQVMNYFQNRGLIFDYENCLNNIDLEDSQKQGLIKLYKNYERGEDLAEDDIGYYYDVARKFTNQIGELK